MGLNLLATSLQIGGSLLVTAGLLAVFATWQRKGVRTGLWRYALAAGWGAVALGVAAWTLCTSPDVGLAWAAVLAMVLGFAIVARQGLALMGQPAKIQRTREIESDGLSLGRGYWGRFAVRLAGSLIVVPLFGFLTGLIWCAWVPGGAAEQLMGMAILAMVAMAAGLVIQLASRRPYRSCLGLILCSAFAAALVFLPRVLA